MTVRYIRWLSVVVLLVSGSLYASQCPNCYGRGKIPMGYHPASGWFRSSFEQVRRYGGRFDRCNRCRGTGRLGGGPAPSNAESKPPVVRKYKPIDPAKRIYTVLDLRNGKQVIAKNIVETGKVLACLLEDGKTTYLKKTEVKSRWTTTKGEIDAARAEARGEDNGSNVEAKRGEARMPVEKAQPLNSDLERWIRKAAEYGRTEAGMETKASPKPAKRTQIKPSTSSTTPRRSVENEVCPRCSGTGQYEYYETHPMKYSLRSVALAKARDLNQQDAMRDGAAVTKGFAGSVVSVSREAVYLPYQRSDGWYGVRRARPQILQCPCVRQRKDREMNKSVGDAMRKALR